MYMSEGHWSVFIISFSSSYIAVNETYFESTLSNVMFCFKIVIRRIKIEQSRFTIMWTVAWRHILNQQVDMTLSHVMFFFGFFVWPGFSAEVIIWLSLIVNIISNIFYLTAHSESTKWCAIKIVHVKSLDQNKQ